MLNVTVFKCKTSYIGVIINKITFIVLWSVVMSQHSFDNIIMNVLLLRNLDI